MANDEYELLPHAELEHLRREVDRLKRNPLGDTQASIGLLESINSLNENVKRLVDIFQSANDDMARMSRDGNALEQLRRLRDENAKIAHGIVALSEMIEGAKDTAPEQHDEMFGGQQDMYSQDEEMDGQQDMFQQDQESGAQDSFDFSPEPSHPASQRQESPPKDGPVQKPMNPFTGSDGVDQFTDEPLPPPPRR